jgi:nucleotide-binding universal stress UspA family protein
MAITHVTTVLVAVDDSDKSVEAARCAYEIFGSGANFFVINVHPPDGAWAPAVVMQWGGLNPYPLSSSDPLVRDELAACRHADQACKTARSVAAEAGMPATVEGRIGDPARVILNAAEMHHADVIVAGANDKSWWRRLLEPSVAEALVRESRTPVLIVHSERRRSEPDRAHSWRSDG